MISFMTPNIVDSLIWIIPNIIAILIRPYLIRYVHKAHKSHRMRSEAFLINFFIILATVGAFMISQSGLMNHSKKGFHVRFFLTKGIQNCCVLDWMDVDRNVVLTDRVLCRQIQANSSGAMLRQKFCRRKRKIKRPIVHHH